MISRVATSRRLVAGLIFGAAMLDGGPAAAATLDGERLPVALALPFVGMLLSIALGPLVAKEWWHVHYAKAAAVWSALALGGLVATAGVEATAAALFHAFALEYAPFVLMLLALFTAAGGLALAASFRGAPGVNCGLLAAGALCASVIGTTGASMTLLRPVIRANADRRRNTHVIVFFIFLVSNIGGVLTPLGDPPLFLGFLHGVDFFWTTRHLWPHAAFAIGVLLATFFVLDSFFWRREAMRPAPNEPFQIRVSGLVNLPLIALAVAAVAASGMWRPGLDFEILGTRLELQGLLREATMIAVTLASLALTSPETRARNDFDWEPIREVAYLFAGIFVCIIPVMAMLKAGAAGPFAPVIALLRHADGAPNAAAYFWATGLLSSALDNAPTYLVFFELAGGDPGQLMGDLAPTLAAISVGAVFMGALTYMGNAPNFMVYAIARNAGVAMPGFFSYMLWSGAFLLPLFAVIAALFF